MNSVQSECHIVVYHYVRDSARTRFPGIKARSISTFESQIAYLASHYRILNLKEYLAEKTSHTDPVCVLTFDDGLKDHLEIVAPILNRFGVSGTFFISTEPIVEGTMASVHKTHFLLSVVGAPRLSELVMQALEERYPDVASFASVPQSVNNPWDDAVTVYLKKTLALLPEETRRDILTPLFVEHIGDEKAFCRELYLSRDEVRALRDSGMEIGGHSHTHRLFTHLTKGEQEKEIVSSRDILASFIDEPVVTFSYPNGCSTPEAVEVLKTNNFHGAVTIDVGVNDSKTDPYLLKRVDTNDVPLT